MPINRCLQIQPVGGKSDGLYNGQIINNDKHSAN
jgi:hypothetical protein